jgi:hypothetical protein
MPDCSGNLPTAYCNRWFRIEPHDSLRQLCLNLVEMFHEAFESAVFGQHLFSNFMQLFDNRIFDHSQGSRSSGGVQINGGSYPDARQTAYTCGSMFAFAMCLQFQLSK